MTPEQYYKKLDDKRVAMATKAAQIVQQFEHLDFITEYIRLLQGLDWQETIIECKTKSFIEEHNLTLKQLAPFLRAALTGVTESPPIFNVMFILGKAETVARLSNPNVMPKLRHKC